MQVLPRVGQSLLIRTAWNDDNFYLLYLREKYRQKTDHTKEVDDMKFRWSQKRSWWHEIACDHQPNCGDQTVATPNFTNDCIDDHDNLRYD